VEPAEPREIIEKSEEVERGIHQVSRLQQAANQNSAPIRSALAIDESYTLTWAVASETFVGTAYIQQPEVPVVRTQHLLRKLKRGVMLSAACQWLERREYLPAEGVHYRIEEVEAKVGRWILLWHGTMPLVEEEYV
jgi:hypothetical protein